MNDGQKYAAYLIVWGLFAIVFTVLRKREKNSKKKKAISLIGSLLILVLVFGVAIWMGLPLKPLSLFVVLALGMVYIGQKYTCYCQSCGHVQQQLFSKVEFCSKCGKKFNL